MRRMNAAIEASMIVKVQDHYHRRIGDDVRHHIHRRWWYVRARTLIDICRTLARDITGVQ